jgi:biotin carboxylase
MTSKNSSLPPSLLIVDLGWSHTFLFAAELVSAGMRVHVLGGNIGAAPFLPKGLTFHKRPLQNDADDEALILSIEEALRETDSDKVLPMAEETLFKIWRSKPKWIDKVVPNIPEQERHRYLSKHQMTAFINAGGAAAPRTVRLVDGTPDEVAAVIAELSLPIVVKTHAGVAGSGVHIANSEEGTLALVREAFEREGQWPALQAYVSGPTYLVGGVFCDGRAVRLVAARKTEVEPAVTGPSIRLLTTADPQLLDAARHVFRSLQFTGIASADFMRGANGKYLFLEVNPRPWGSIGVARRAGVDVIPAWVRMLRGCPNDA